MRYLLYIFVTVAFLFSTNKGLSQGIDSLHLYAISMTSSYHTTISRDLIKNEVEPILIKDTGTINSINAFFQDNLKGRFIKKLKSNYIDIRLSAEFFSDGKIVKTIGVTSYNDMFIDKKLYSYERSKLKGIDKYIPSLSRVLNIK